MGDDLQYRCHGTQCGDNGEDRFKGVCDKNGCDIQAYRFNVRDFYGPGDKFKINSLKPVTVTTQFMTDDGTDSGTINKVEQFYTQNGKTIEHPMYEPYASLSGRDLNGPFLFNLSEDPTETNNLCSKNQEWCDSMLQALKNFRDSLDYSAVHESKCMPASSMVV